MSLPVLKNSLKIQLDKLPAYSAFKGDWTYAIPRNFITAILSCNEKDKDGNALISEVCKSSFKNNIVDALRNGVLTVEWKTTAVP